MRYAIRGALALTGAILLTSCGSIDGADRRPGVQSKPAPSTGPATIVSDDVVKLGTPYTVAGTTYTPVDLAAYDEVGFASYYGRELAGQPTANGEIFNPAGISGAHKTLPMPSYVEVTSLDTGRTILVRINDRGPFANDRLIDLSEGAARQLGLGPEGLAGVRVRRVNPPEQEKSVLRQGLAAAERIETPGPLLKVLRDKLAKQPRPALAQRTPPLAGRPLPVESPHKMSGDRFIREGGRANPKPKSQSANANKPAAAATGDFVAQLGAFSSKARADALAKRVGATVAASADGRLFRVRLGPFGSEAEAAAAARRSGYPQARIYHD